MNKKISDSKNKENECLISFGKRKKLFSRQFVSNIWYAFLQIDVAPAPPSNPKKIKKNCELKIDITQCYNFVEIPDCLQKCPGGVPKLSMHVNCLTLLFFIYQYSRILWSYDYQSHGGYASNNRETIDNLRKPQALWCSSAETGSYKLP